MEDTHVGDNNASTHIPGDNDQPQTSYFDRDSIEFADADDIPEVTLLDENNKPQENIPLDVLDSGLDETPDDHFVGSVRGSVDIKDTDPEELPPCVIIQDGKSSTQNGKDIPDKGKLIRISFGQFSKT